MFLPHKLVTKEFRDLVASQLPGLGDNYAHWRLLEHVLFGTWVDEESDQLILSAKQAAYLVGKEREWLNHRFTIQPLLDQFSTDVFPLDTVGVVFNHFTQKNKAGQVVTTIPQWLKDAVAVERRTYARNKVEFATGRKWSNPKQAATICSARLEAANLAANAGCHESKRVLEYMNGLASNSFSRIREHLPSAHAKVEALAIDVERQHNLLQSIEQMTIPLYKPVESSVRVYSMTESFLRLKREVREVLTVDWYKADLRAAQLAIAASKWGAPKLMAFLQTGDSIWNELLTWMQLPATEYNKGELKDLMYSVVFGKAKDNLSLAAKHAWPQLKNPGERLRKHPIVKELLNVRTIQFEAIRATGQATDAFGRIIRLRPKGANCYHYQPDTAKSLLAQVAQSYELKLMLPILELAESHGRNDGFTIMMWLHDGICVKFHDARRIEHLKRRITEAVGVQAKLLGIPTYLLWE